MVKEVDSFTPSVLVVDPNPTHCLLYQMEIGAKGYEVICAHSGHDALQKIQHRSFDVAVVDVVLPDVKGIDLVKEISSTHQNLPIIINTAYPYRKSHFRRWAVEAFVLKSSDLNELTGKIAMLLNHRRSNGFKPETGRRNQTH